MRSSKLVAIMLTAAIAAAALIVSGCASPTPSATPSPTATPTPTPTPKPTLSPVDKEYQYVEQLTAGTNNYNAAVDLHNTAQSLFNQSDYSNASRTMKMASDRMALAQSNYTASLTYASTAQEISLSQKWIEAMDNYTKSYQNASEAYADYVIEHARPQPNLVKYNNYVVQANSYQALAEQSRKQAEAIESNMTFIVPTKVP